MVDINIQRCRFRFCRHGGWRWGQSPERLVSLAQELLPEIILETLADILGETRQDLSIRHLKIDISLNKLGVSLSQLAKIKHKDAISLPWQSYIKQRIRSALISQVGDLTLKQDPPNSQNDTRTPVIPRMAPTKTLHALLLTWLEEGTFYARLSLIDSNIQALWESSLWEASKALKSNGDLSQQEEAKLSALVQKTLKLYAKAPAVTIRIATLTTLLKDQNHSFSTQALVGLFSRYLNDETPIAPTLHLANVMTAPTHTVKAIKPDMLGELKPNKNGSQTLSKGLEHKPKQKALVLEVDSILPFIVVGELARHDYFSVLDTHLSSLEPTSSSAPPAQTALAVALAYKVLPPPERHLVYSPPVKRCANALAGGLSELSASDIQTFADESLSLSVVDAHLNISLQRGHHADSPILLRKVASKYAELWTLHDIKGHYSLGWFTNLEDLIPIVRNMHSSLWLIHESAVDTALFSILNEHDCQFVTTFAPARHETWVPLYNDNHLWTNYPALSTQLNITSEQVEEWANIADSLSQSLLRSRALFYGSESKDEGFSPRKCFDYSISFAASTALSSIAERLWSTQEESHPLMALDRLGDLSGKVTITASSITVQPILGQRFLHLYRAGLLQSIPQLPWLEGRCVEFEGL